LALLFLSLGQNHRDTEISFVEGLGTSPSVVPPVLAGLDERSTSRLTRRAAETNDKPIAAYDLESFYPSLSVSFLSVN
jgi:hypothetical protein